MQAVVHTSNAGHTDEYAKMLGEKTGLPVYALSDATKQLSSGTESICCRYSLLHSRRIEYDN